MLAHATFRKIGVTELDGLIDQPVDMDHLRPGFCGIIFLDGCCDSNPVRDRKEHRGQEFVAARSSDSVMPFDV